VATGPGGTSKKLRAIKQGSRRRTYSAAMNLTSLLEDQTEIKIIR